MVSKSSVSLAVGEHSKKKNQLRFLLVFGKTKSDARQNQLRFKTHTHKKKKKKTN